MQFPKFFGIKDLAELTWRKYNQDLQDIRNWWNDHDSGARTWTNVIATNATITNLKGTTTNDNAATGMVGEYITSLVQGVSAAANGNYQDTTTISLTAGDWDVSGMWEAFRNSSTWGGTIEFGLSIGTAGNAFSDNNVGDNRFDQTLVLAQDFYSIGICAWRQSLTTTTVVRLKTLYTYSAGTPQTSGRLVARRVR